MSDAEVLTRRVIPAEPSPINTDLFFAACKAKGAITDEHRARLLGMPRRSVYRYIHGEVEPLLFTARWIASQLDVQVDELWPAA